MPVGFAMALVGFVGFCYVVSFKAGLNMISSVLWDTFSKYGLTVIPLVNDSVEMPAKKCTYGVDHSGILVRTPAGLVGAVAETGKEFIHQRMADRGR